MASWLQNVHTGSLVVWLSVVAAVAIPVALLIPPVKWASSGSVTIPVDVIVFDALSATPINSALVAIVWAPPASGEFELSAYQDRLSGGFRALEEIGARTNSAGRVTIDHEFRSGANYERPTPHAHTRWYWLLVSAEDYGNVAVPLRYESMTTTELRTQGRLPAYVGLTRLESN